jgi:Flp pilus assembly protein TadG
MNGMNRAHIKWDERGQAVVEFAIIVPLIAMLLFAILEFGIVFNNYLTLTDAVRAGARKAAVSRHIPTGRHGIVEAAVRASAEGIDNEDLDVHVSTSWAAGSDVEVSASYPYSIDVFGLEFMSGELESTTTERVE